MLKIGDKIHAKSRKAFTNNDGEVVGIVTQEDYYHFRHKKINSNHPCAYIIHWDNDESVGGRVVEDLFNLFVANRTLNIKGCKFVKYEEIEKYYNVEHIRINKKLKKRR